MFTNHQAYSRGAIEDANTQREGRAGYLKMSIDNAALFSSWLMCPGFNNTLVSSTTDVVAYCFDVY
jgi:hypothetical protein